MTMNVANIFSLLRILLSPVFFVLFITGGNTEIIIGSVILFIAAITDFFDGWFARKYHEVTKTGKFIDPLADKFLTSFAFIAFAIMNIIPFWMVVIIILRDILTTVMRIFAVSGGIHIKTSWPAKTKTFLQMLFIAYIVFLLFLRSIASEIYNQQLLNKLIFSDLSYFIMLMLTVLTVWTALEYIYHNRKFFNSVMRRGS